MIIMSLIFPSAGGEGLYVWRPVPPSDLYVALGPKKIDIQKIYEKNPKSSKVCTLITRAGAVCTTDASEPRGVDGRCVGSSAAHSQSISAYPKSDVHYAVCKCVESILMPYLFV